MILRNIIDVRKVSKYIGVWNKRRVHMDNRKHMGKDNDGVIFPVAPYLSEMGDSYLEFIEEIKKEIQKQRVSVVMNANASMICL